MTWSRWLHILLSTRALLLIGCVVALAACGDATTDYVDAAPVTVETAPRAEGQLPYEPGDDDSLDGLFDACEAGDLDACDDLWNAAPAGSEYERFAATCGERIENPSTAFGACAEHGASDDVPFAEGDDDRLDALHAACRDGDLARCDRLWQQSPRGSEYELYGATCGGRIDVGQANAGNCADVAK